jgi:hypothetical protein
MFGPKRNEVVGGWRRLHNEELHNLYASPNVIRVVKSRRVKWTRHVARIGEISNTYSVLVGKPKGNRPLGRPRRIWEDNIKMGKVKVKINSSLCLNKHHEMKAYWGRGGIAPNIIDLCTRWR